MEAARDDDEKSSDNSDNFLEKADRAIERLRNKQVFSSPHDDDDDDDENIESRSDSELANATRMESSRLGGVLSHIHVLSRAPAQPHVSVTSSEGRRVYLRLRDGNRWEKSSHSDSRAASRQLLSVPYAELKARVEEKVSI